MTLTIDFFLDSEGLPHLRNNLQALQNGTYHLVGEMIATMFVQCGLHSPFFDSTAVQYLLRGSTKMAANLQDMPNAIRHQLEKVACVFWQCF